MLGAMTASDADALTARWRRLEHGLDEVRAAVNSPDPHRCPDAVARALGALYDLWEFWAPRAALPPVKGKTAQQDAAVSGDDDVETAAALVHARGSLTHVHAEFGSLTDTVSGNRARAPRLLALAGALGCAARSPRGPGRLVRRSRAGPGGAAAVGGCCALAAGTT